MPLIPRGYVPVGALQSYNIVGNLRNHNLIASEGRILSRWQDPGWGSDVAYDKQYNGYFRDDLVEAVANMYEMRWKPSPTPHWVACVPSQNHPTLVPDFAQRLANRLGLPFLNVIQKVRNNEPQKNQQNSFHQCRNLDGAFAISGTIPQTPVLLVDDIIDSRWTVTVLAALLRQNGSGSCISRRARFHYARRLTDVPHARRPSNHTTHGTFPQVGKRLGQASDHNRVDESQSVVA